MKPFIIVLLLFRFVNGFAQETSIALSSGMYENNVIRLAAKDGLIFSAGNEISWADTRTDVAGWQILKPVDLTIRPVHKY